MTSFNPDLCPERLSRWFDCTSTEALPPHLVSWMDDRGSLTARLKQHCEVFQVNVLRQGPGIPIGAEQTLLNQLDCDDQQFLVREVLLLCDGQPWVFARTLMPDSALTGRFRRFRDLDERPLGPLLFSDPEIQRGPMQWLRVNVFELSLPLWGRRSAFLLAEKPVLVSEIFLPASAAYPEGDHSSVERWQGAQDDCYAG